MAFDAVVLEKLALSFVTNHPDLVGQFAGHLTSKILHDKMPQADPGQAQAVASEVSQVVVALIPAVLQAVAK